MNSSRSKSKSQPDLTKLCGDAENRESNNSATNTLNFNDFVMYDDHMIQCLCHIKLLNLKLKALNLT